MHKALLLQRLCGYSLGWSQNLSDRQGAFLLQRFAGLNKTICISKLQLEKVTIDLQHEQAVLQTQRSLAEQLVMRCACSLTSMPSNQAFVISGSQANC